jgi:HD-GYP domain-containing protein (c-di-GMP phosphodiesterase class II)
MSETRVLLDKIVALRQQLERAKGLAHDAGSAAAPSPGGPTSEPHCLGRLERQLEAGARSDSLLHEALRQLSIADAETMPPTFPSQLTSRARRLLEQGRQLVAYLRTFADQLGQKTAGDSPRGSDHLEKHYQDTVAMANAALRMVQAFPDAPSAQLQLCEGLEVILKTAEGRVNALRLAVTARNQREAQVDALAGLLSDLSASKPVTIKPFVALAESIIAEAQEGMALRFLWAQPCVSARFVACHSLTVARVIARVVRFDPELRGQSLEAVLTGLLHDVGMLSVPLEIVAHPGPLDDTQRRAVEQHTRVGAEMMARLLPEAAWLAESAGCHHERLDGTGYPAGLRQAQLGTLPRLLAVCDVYAALCAERPHRHAFDTRTALTDTLLEADRGQLDRFHADKLMLLSAYPVGSLVELADGAIAEVVATHPPRREARMAHVRPVIALLTDEGGQLLPVKRHLDLAQCEHRSIVRALSEADKQALLSRLDSLAAAI